MPFGVGYDSVGQAPGAQQGFQQQLAQMQQGMPQLIQKLQDPQYRMQAAQQLAGQMPAPPANFVGSGTPGQENSVGLPQGVRPDAPAPNQPGFQANPFDFSEPASLAQAQSAQQQANRAFGGPTPGTGPQDPVGVAPEAGPGGGGGGGGYLNTLMQDLLNPSVAPGMSLPGDFLTPAISKLPMSLMKGLF